MSEASDMRVYRAICAAADANRPCPSNPTIADMLCSTSLSASVKCLERLAARGLIAVRRFQVARQVTVLATGRSTYLDPSQAQPHWRDTATGRAVAARPKGEKQLHRVVQTVVDDEALPEPVHRDPCPRCGVRADIGCSHQFARLSMGAFA